MPLIATSKLQAHNFLIQIKVMCLSFSAMPPQRSFVCMCCSQKRQTDLEVLIKRQIVINVILKSSCSHCFASCNHSYPVCNSLTVERGAR